MTDELSDQLVELTEELRGLISIISTEHLGFFCAASMQKHLVARGGDSPVLQSPLRQLQFVLALMLGSPEPEKRQVWTEDQRRRVVEILNQIGWIYGFSFFGHDGASSSSAGEGGEEAPLHAFLHYFNTGLLASVEQVCNRIRTELSPFDDTVREAAGISSADALRVADHISSTLVENAAAIQSLAAEEHDLRLRLVEKAKKERWGEEELRANVNPRHWPLAEQILSTVDGLITLQLSDLRDVMGDELADSYIAAFGATRGHFPPPTYYTEDHASLSRPVLVLPGGQLMVPLVNELYSAILKVGEGVLSASPVRDSFLRHRDKSLEDQTAAVFERGIFEGAELWRNAYETEDLHHEHDLVARVNDVLLIVESKASGPVEPFRDPERAMRRLRHSFSGDRGIQKAYEQGNHARARLRDEGILRLFNARREQCASFESAQIRQVFCCCVTRGNYGPLATNLHLLLEKSPGDLYPWAVPIHDLEALAEAFEYFGFGVDRFFEYLAGRELQHGFAISSDELENAGYFIEHGGFDELPLSPDGVAVLGAHYSDVFDSVYQAIYQDGEQVKYSPKPPVITDVRRALEAEGINLPGPRWPGRKQGRNEKCACGSGLKYKRCCGKS